MTAMYELRDAELDAVAAGQLLELEINNNDVAVAVPVNAAVAANILGGAALANATQPGRIGFRQ